MNDTPIFDLDAKFGSHNAVNRTPMAHEPSTSFLVSTPSRSQKERGRKNTATGVLWKFNRLIKYWNGNWFFGCQPKMRSKFNGATLKCCWPWMGCGLNDRSTNSIRLNSTTPRNYAFFLQTVEVKVPVMVHQVFEKHTKKNEEIRRTTTRAVTKQERNRTLR